MYARTLSAASGNKRMKENTAYTGKNDLKKGSFVSFVVENYEYASSSSSITCLTGCFSPRCSMPARS